MRTHGQRELLTYYRLDNGRNVMSGQHPTAGAKTHLLDMKQNVIVIRNPQSAARPTTYDLHIK